MIKHKLTYFVLLALIVFNCKSAKTIVDGESNFGLSTKQLIKENAKQTPNFKTLRAKLKIDYIIKENSKSVNVNLRLEKDKTIWMSAFYGVGKVLITPSRVAFYDKWNNQYFDGDYVYLSDLLGTELDFQKVQNLLFGEAVYNLKNDNYKLSVDDGNYILQPKKQRELFELFLLLDPSYFKIKSQQISQTKEFRHLQIDYLTHQKIDNQILPELIKIIAVEANEETIIKMEFKNVSLNEDLRFPFKIPSGFKEIKL
jgi:hypothetical protein